MIFRSPGSNPRRAVDPALLGFWTHRDGMILIEADGWQYSVAASTATLSADGQTLTDAGPPFTRRLGSGPGIDGLWGAILTHDGSTFDEERRYRSDGTFTVQVMKDGVFETLTFGTYTWRNDILATRERRAIVTTGPGNSIDFDIPFGLDATGTYAFTGPDSWDLTLGATTYSFTRS